MSLVLRSLSVTGFCFLALFRVFRALCKLPASVRLLFIDALFERFLLEKFNNFSHLTHIWSHIAKNNGASAGDFVISHCM